MNVKNVNVLSLFIMLIGVILMVINHFVLKLPDGIVRTVGIILLLAIFAFSFSSVRLRNTKA